MQQYLNVHKLSPDKDPQRSSLYRDMVQDIFNEITLASGTLTHIVINHNNTLKTVQPNIIVEKQETLRVKWGVITKVFNWLFGGDDNSDKVFDVYKIHSLPLLHPVVKKCVTFKFESPYMAISQDQLFVTYPSLDEILTCQMAQGSYCEINKPLHAIDKTKQCAIYLFKQQRSQIN